MTAVSQRLRNRIVKAGFAIEPMKHVRPVKCPCLYVETTNPKTGCDLARRFTFEGKKYAIRYADGCFLPFIFACE